MNEENLRDMEGDLDCIKQKATLEELQRVVEFMLEREIATEKSSRNLLLSKPPAPTKEGAMKDAEIQFDPNEVELREWCDEDTCSMWVSQENYDRLLEMYHELKERVKA